MTPECGSRRVAKVGTPEQVITSSLPMAWVEIYALDTNTTDVYWGNANVRAVVGGEAGLPMAAGTRLYLKDVDLSTIWIDVRTANEGVTWGGQRP